MFDYIEVTAWSVEEVRSHLNEAIPEGWKFEQGANEEYLWARILREDGVVVWDLIHLDERTLLLGAYCWLSLRSEPKTRSNSIWSERRKELTRRGVTQRVVSVPDPEDLDPEEIRSVYELTGQKRS